MAGLLGRLDAKAEGLRQVPGPIWDSDALCGQQLKEHVLLELVVHPSCPIPNSTLSSFCVSGRAGCKRAEPGPLGTELTGFSLPSLLLPSSFSASLPETTGAEL